MRAGPSGVTRRDVRSTERDGWLVLQGLRGIRIGCNCFGEEKVLPWRDVFPCQCHCYYLYFVSAVGRSCKGAHGIVFLTRIDIPCERPCVFGRLKLRYPRSLSGRLSVANVSWRRKTSTKSPLAASLRTWSLPLLPWIFHCSMRRWELGACSPWSAAAGGRCWCCCCTGRNLGWCC